MDEAGPERDHLVTAQVAVELEAGVERLRRVGAVFVEVRQEIDAHRVVPVKGRPSR